MGARQSQPSAPAITLTSLPLAPASWWGDSQTACWRWAVDADSWLQWESPQSEEFNLLLGLIPEEAERARITKLHWKDQRRSLVGHLLMRRSCAQVLGHEDFTGHTIGRTYGQKPFLLEPLPPSLPNFNFNVSHDGRWVVLASDALRLVGTDISAPQRDRNDREDDEYLKDLRSLMHDAEIWAIERMPTVRERYSVFQRIWSAKESVTKAIGQGVDFGLGRIEAKLDGDEGVSLLQMLPWFKREAKRAVPISCPYAEVSIDMWPYHEWDLKQHQLPINYWVTVALGPVSEAVDRNGTFIATLRQPHVDEMARRLEAQLPVPVFKVLAIEDLLPEAARAELFRIRMGPCAYG